MTTPEAREWMMREFAEVTMKRLSALARTLKGDDERIALDSVLAIQGLMSGIFQVPVANPSPKDIRRAPMEEITMDDIVDERAIRASKTCRPIAEAMLSDQIQWRLDPHYVTSSQAVLDVIAERRRQVEVEDFDASHDDMATKGQLATAAACYAFQAGARGRRYPGDPEPIGIWPWDREWWKPSTDHRRNLIKAAALIIAEIERLDRAAAKEGSDRG